MFYSDSILTRKGPLANIWLAAHWDRRLSKAQIVGTNIEGSLRAMVEGRLPPMALRLSGQLLLGVTKIYGRKARYLLEDCTEALGRLRLAFNRTGGSSSTDLPAHASKASHAAITMATVSNLEDALAPEPELDLEALLRETAEAPLTKTLGNSGSRDNGALSRHFGLFAEEEMARLGEDLVRDSELALDPTTNVLPSELLAELDQLPSATRQSIEVGRRAPQSPAGMAEGGEGSPFAGVELFRPSLPYSPLRKGAAVGSSLDMMMEKPVMKEGEEEVVPLNEFADPYDQGMEGEVLSAAGGDGHGRPSAELPSVTDIDAIVSVKTKKSTLATRTRRQARGARRLVLDLETELSNISVQGLVRNPLSLLLPPLDATDATLKGYLYLLNQQFGEKTSQGEEGVQGKTVEAPVARSGQVPPLVNEEGDYFLGPEDYAMDLVEEEETRLELELGMQEEVASAHRSIRMSSPKSPRLMLSIENDENTVPDHVNNTSASNRSAPGTPSKAASTSILKPPLDEAALDALERWQKSLRLEGSVEFDGGLLKAGTSRREAAEAFHQLLMLTSKGLVRTEQITPYESIMVRATSTLFTATAADVAQ